MQGLGLSAGRAPRDLLSSAAMSLQNAKLYDALRLSEERYAQAIEAATDGHAYWIADEDVLHASPRLLEQWGISSLDLVCTSRRQMLDVFPFHPEDRERVLVLLEQHRKGDASQLEFQTRVVRGTEVRWMRCTILSVRDGNGQLLRASIATSDVTERVRAEEELRQSEERFALALAGTNEGVCDWDLRTGRAYLAAGTQQLLGIPVGEPWRTHDEWHAAVTYYPGDQERMQAALDAHFSNRTPYDHEVRIIMGSGEVRHFRARGTALRDADGVPYRMVGSISDITERKRQQEEMLGLQSRLRQAERFEAMGTLAGGIAHDFNNILGAILGLGERALRLVDEGSPARRDLSNVLMAAERGRTLVDRILSFSRGTACERVPVHVEQVVRDTLKLLKARLPAHVQLHTRLQAGRAAILGNAAQIHQLLMNLATNAAQAMVQGGKLMVSLAVEEIRRSRHATVGCVTPGAWMLLQVSDEGSGITPEILELIFDPFFTTRDGVGTGLGLSLVQRIVTQSGGAIDVDTTPGGGSVFTVYLPRVGDAPEEAADDARANPRGQGQRVLVVEDEEALLELTTTALHELGYRPTGYGSARAALEAFRAHPDDFDLLLTDMRMPAMSGEMLIREARRVRPLLPAILVSGYVGDVMPAPDRHGSADEVLTKPLRGDALATSLARVLDSS